MENPICKLFNIKYPLIQAGMIWCSGWELASAVSNAGGLGLIGAGSMYPDVLRQHIQKCKKATTKPFGVNVPLLYPNIHALIFNSWALRYVFNDIYVRFKLGICNFILRYCCDYSLHLLYKYCFNRTY